MIDPWWRADNIKHTYEGNPNLNPSLQLFSQELCRKAFLYFEQQLRGAFEEDLSAAAAALGAEVNNMVCYLDHVHIVLDHQYGIAPVHELIQHFQQMMDVFKMQTGGRLVENIKSFARVALGQLGGQLYPLRLAATQRYGRLAKRDVSQAHILEHFDLAVQQRNVLKEFRSLFHGHVQYIGNGFALVTYLQRFAVVALAVAFFAMDIYVRQEIHFNGAQAASFAHFAAAAFHIEGKAPRIVAADLGFGDRGE